MILSLLSRLPVVGVLARMVLDAEGIEEYIAATASAYGVRP